MATFTDQGNSVDVYMRQTEPTTNKDGAQLQIGESDAIAQLNRTLIKWDISSIPADAVVNSAVLSIYTIAAGSDDASNTRTLRAYKVLRDWVETQATWNEYSTGNAWGTAGCSNTSNDREATDMGSVSVDAAFADATELQITLTASEVQEWIANSATNFGVLLKMDTEDGDSHLFESSESLAGTGVKPKLVINYSVGVDSGFMFMSN